MHLHFGRSVPSSVFPELTAFLFARHAMWFGGLSVEILQLPSLVLSFLQFLQFPGHLLPGLLGSFRDSFIVDRAVASFGSFWANDVEHFVRRLPLPLDS